MKRIHVTFPCGDIKLEGVWHFPDTAAPFPAVIVCHPHSLHGGNMSNNVVWAICQALAQDSIAALRFNFRGVGLSQGTHDEGRGEKDDLRAAVDELQTRFPNLPLVLGGFSFGSAVALRVGIPDPRVRALFALGFPATFISDTSFLDEGGKPRLFIQCENDPFGSGDAMRKLVEGLPEPRSVVIIPGGDHLFSERLDELEEALAAWVGGSPWEAA